MKVVNEVLPSDPDRITAMQEPGPSGPIVMVNLLKFREKAQYADGRDPHLTGRQAYGRYAAEVIKLLPQYSARVVFSGDVTFLALGQVEELWDEIAMVEYTDRGCLWAMSMSKDWLAASVHREAGLAGQLNIETTRTPGLESLGAKE